MVEAAFGSKGLSCRAAAVEGAGQTPDRRRNERAGERPRSAGKGRWSRGFMRRSRRGGGWRKRKKMKTWLVGRKPRDRASLEANMTSVGFFFFLRCLRSSGGSQGDSRRLA
ncbi:unnamed protein product [Pleuronectes platessa]|uniref:Uncharacterized protein n=1 Tax=Pleuronectes platessa TaxID=8262 RepID=A0A9N7VJ15_PLEPL|nr:unnamed protein product [Pleuronectes platessa]